MDATTLYLRKNEDRRLRAGHLWVFSNEVDTARSPITDVTPGAPVIVRDSGGRPVGAGYANPRSLICVRLLSHNPAARLDRALLRERIGRALALRNRLFATPYYRLVFGEGDGLPGLVVDRFGGILVVQVTTAGMESVLDEVVSALDEAITPAGILLRNDTGSRELEGLDRYVRIAAGEVPDEVEVEENGARFVVSLAEGQKTGWFFDHRQNRARAARFAQDSRVLDLFSYAGAWGVQAAVGGAAEVLCVDASADALRSAERSAALNGVEERVRTRAGDAFEVLRELRDAGDRFDLVVLDPPAFAKRRKDARAGEQAYRRLNRAALQVLRPDGILVSASCSFHLPRAALRGAMLWAARGLDRDLQILEQGHQAADHPVHPAIPETDYLKCFTARVG